MYEHIKELTTSWENCPYIIYFKYAINMINFKCFNTSCRIQVAINCNVACTILRLG